MRLNTAPTDTALMSGVLETTQFAIKTSAKAFEILSSGLYANKIRAIIRELSCNAYDSHVSAGCKERPFDVHLPTHLEPFFSIRDYGIGLSHHQVVTIFTTYFESTKTDSNELIGGLGLGSKAPFSYTNNFTVTAVKDGIKGVYSAFVSDAGVPSVALLSQSETDEVNGVEIQFSVEDSYDFRKFYEEAERVYEYFDTAPVFTGHAVTVRRREYTHKDVAPGIHIVKGQQRNVAVMGNISYPIDVPNADKLLKELVAYNNCGLEIHFGIGDIEFQASREGLSYTPATIRAICERYRAFGATMAPAVYKQLHCITNKWERLWELQKLFTSNLWREAATSYMNKYQFTLAKHTGRHLQVQPFKVSVKTLETVYNINLSQFAVSHGWNRNTVRAEKVERSVSFYPAITVKFMLNPKNRKFATRLKEYNGTGALKSTDTLFVLSPKDHKKPMLSKEFFQLISSPPDQLIFSEEVLPVKARAERSATPQLLLLKQDGYNYDWKWADEYYEPADVVGAGPFYYVPIKGFSGTLKGKAVDVKDFCKDVNRSGVIKGHAFKLFGVRSEQLEAVQQDNRFRLLETELINEISSVGKRIAYSGYINNRVLSWIKKLTPASATSEFTKMKQNVLDTSTDICYVENVCKSLDINFADIKKQAEDEIAQFYQYYPLLKHLDSNTNEAAVIEYIDLIDSSKENI